MMFRILILLAALSLAGMLPALAQRKPATYMPAPEERRQLDEKKQALAEYRSQLEQTDYMHSGLGLNAYRSAAFNGNYGRFAEAFCSVPLEQYRAMFDAYRGSA